MVETGGQLVLPFRRTGGIFHHSADSTHIKVHGLFPHGKALDELGNLQHIFLRTRHFIVEIRSDFKELVELLIISAEQFIIITAADHDDFDIGRDGFRFQCRRNHCAQLFPNGIHVDFFCLDDTAQSFPRLRSGEDILCLHDKITAVRLVEQTAFDFHKVCGQVTEFAVVFHFPHQIIVSGIECGHHRGAFCFAVIHNQIYFIFQCHIFRLFFGKHRQQRCQTFFPVVLIFKELADIFQYIFFYRVDICHCFFVLLIFLLNSAHMVTDGKHTNLIVQLIYAPFGFLIQFPNVPHNGRSFFLYNLGIFLNDIFHVFRKVVIFFLTYRFPIHHRHKVNAGIGSLYLKIIFRRFFAHLIHESIPFFIKTAKQFCFLLFIVLCTEYFLQFRLEQLHQFIHIIPELSAFPCWKGQRQRASGVLEVINIAPVQRHFFRCRQTFCAGFGIGGFPCAGGS